MVEPIIRFAKILVDGTGHDSGIDRDVYHKAIEERALATKRPSETLAQAYSRAISEPGSEAELLFKAYKRAPAGKQPVQAAQDLKMNRSATPLPSLRKWRARRRRRKISATSARTLRYSRNPPTLSCVIASSKRNRT